MIDFWKLLIGLSIFGSITVIFGQQTTPDGCYQTFPNSKVNCLTPYNQQSGVTDQQCRDLCSQNPTCKGAQYNQMAKTCQLYQTSVKRNKRDADNDTLDIQTRHGGGGCHGGGGHSGGHGGGGPPGGGRRPPPQGPPRRPGPPPPGPPPRGRKKRGGQGHGQGHGCGGGGPCQPGLQTAASCYIYYKPTGQCGGYVTATTPVSNLPPEATCPAGQVTRYYLVDGYQLSGTPDATFTASSEQACIDACTNNRLPDGRTVPCRSFDFDTQSGQCAISFQPTGAPQGTPDPRFKHYEKTCVDATFGNKCPGPYFRGPQKILIGYAQAVLNAGSAAECLQICSDSQARFGFSCQSILYYSQETANNCILNSETRTTHPDLYVSENNDKVDYYEPGCAPTRVLRQTRQLAKRNRNVLKPNSPDYSGWTMCDHRVLDHKRFKMCQGMNPNKCQMDKATCDPVKENEYDLDTGSQFVTTTQNPIGNGPISIFTPSTTQPFTVSFGVIGITEFSQFVTITGSGDFGRCEPAIRPDGKKDCDNGHHLGPDGKRQPCKPLKKDC